MFHTHRWTAFAALFSLVVAVTAHAQPQAAEPLTVMSFNIRYDNPGDGVNRWTNRTELVTGVIKDIDPDVLGAQECLDHQAAFLREQLDGYGFIGVGRSDGRTRGEYAPIFYKQDRFTCLASGTIWLSPTPNTPGSVGWDASITRIATWGVLRDVNDERVYAFINTHFDHVGVESRLEAAGILQQLAAQLDASGYEPDGVVITGDFNCGPTEAPIERLTAADAEPFSLTDSYAATHDSEDDSATFTVNGFEGGAPGRRIDYVFASPGLTVHDAGIDRTRGEGDRKPSDHEAVWATVQHTED